MARRHHLALSTQELPCTVADLIEALYDAKVECDVYEIDPQTDAAVMLLTHQLAFQMNADVVNRQVLDNLVAHCKYERNRRAGTCHAAH